MTNLTVPYFSQWDTDARISKNDCGAASLKMVLAHFGRTQYTTDQIVTELGLTGGQFTTVSHIQSFLTKNNLSFQWFQDDNANNAFANMKMQLDKGCPCFCVVHYGDFRSRQDQKFTGGHIFVVVGYREDGVFVNDPDFSYQYRQDGDHHFYTNEEFLTGWKNAVLDGNKPNQFIAVSEKAVGGATVKNTYATVFTKYGYPVDPPVETLDIVFKNFTEWNEKLQKKELLHKNDILVELDTAKSVKELFDFMNDKHFENKLHWPDGLKDVLGALYTGYLKSEESKKIAEVGITTQTPVPSVEIAPQPVQNEVTPVRLVHNDVEITNLINGDDMQKLVEFFNGKKTYVIAVATIAYAVGGAIIGKVDGMEAIGFVLAALGLTTLRSSLSDLASKLAAK